MGKTEAKEHRPLCPPPAGSSKTTMPNKPDMTARSFPLSAGRSGLHGFFAYHHTVSIRNSQVLFGQRVEKNWNEFSDILCISLFSCKNISYYAIFYRKHAEQYLHIFCI
ncbi:MAG: hypothetical protein ACI4PT_00135 [Candidatus Avoscillospira sp.]